jgi:hypothetical protein
MSGAGDRLDWLSYDDFSVRRSVAAGLRCTTARAERTLDDLVDAHLVEHDPAAGYRLPVLRPPSPLASVPRQRRAAPDLVRVAD